MPRGHTARPTTATRGRNFGTAASSSPASQTSPQSLAAPDSAQAPALNRLAPLVSGNTRRQVLGLGSRDTATEKGVVMDAHWLAPAGLHTSSARLPVEGEL